tara:strand:- start:3 stop:233 length:231 start_codon:yes stop_codon:yes gene_type:complete
MKLKNLIKRINENNKPPGGWAASIQALKLNKKEKGDVIEAFSIAILKRVGPPVSRQAPKPSSKAKQSSSPVAKGSS